jgi:hypothetical protein
VRWEIEVHIYEKQGAYRREKQAKSFPLLLSLRLTASKSGVVEVVVTDILERERKRAPVSNAERASERERERSTAGRFRSNVSINARGRTGAHARPRRNARPPCPP